MMYQLAPLEGITTFAYRALHAQIFGGVDRYYTPFFSPTQERRLTTKEERELAQTHVSGVEVVPQVLSKRVDDVLWAIERVQERGFEELNLNLGCPSGTVVAKGKGSGLLADVEALDAFFEELFSKTDFALSVKTRLGLKDPQECLPLLEVFNRYPIAELTLHPRIQKDFYKAPVRPQWFSTAQENCTHNLGYNGDLVSVADVLELPTRFKTVERIMVGRGVIADPALFRKCRGGASATRQELEDFTLQLYQAYQQAYGHKGGAAQRMKEMWFHLIHLFADNERLHKKMRRITTPEAYEEVQRTIFASLDLRQDVSAGEVE